MTENRQTLPKTTRPAIPVGLLVGLLVALMTCTSGCGRRRVPRTADVPSLPHYAPDVFADINPKWSHDGSRIAFLRDTPDRKLQLCVVDTELERPLALLESELVSPDRPYASDLMRYCSPDTLAWSRDDRMIAFERVEWFTFEDGDRVSGTGLWAFDTFSGIARPLAVHPGHYTSYYYFYHTPEWSPDGKYLAFVGEGVNGQRRIFIHPLKGQKSTTASSRFDQFDDSDWPSWKPRSHGSIPDRGQPELALRQGVRRNQIAPPTETIRVLTPGEASVTHCRQLVRIPAEKFSRIANEPLPEGERVSPRSGGIVWSPNGKRVAFTLTPSAGDYNRYQLWTVNADGTDARRVSPKDGCGYFAPVWIGNSRLGALSPTAGKFNVVTVPVEAGHGSIKRIGAIGGSDCDWSPDRSQIVWAGPPIYRPPDPDNASGLQIFSTGIFVVSGVNRR